MVLAVIQLRRHARPGSARRGPNSGGPGGARFPGLVFERQNVAGLALQRGADRGQRRKRIALALPVF